MISREAPLSVFDIVYVSSSLFVLFHQKKLYCLQITNSRQALNWSQSILMSNSPPNAFV